MKGPPATARVATPLGILELTALGGVLTSVRIGVENGAAFQDPSNIVLEQAVRQMEDYFSGHRRTFALPLAQAGTTRGIELRTGIALIAFGETLTYGELAYRIGSSVRAVGQACQRNPFPIIIPCHRVTSSGNAREHYSAGAGPETKAWLLDFEAGRTRLL